MSRLALNIDCQFSEQVARMTDFVVGERRDGFDITIPTKSPDAMQRRAVSNYLERR